MRGNDIDVFLHCVAPHTTKLCPLADTTSIHHSTCIKEYDRGFAFSSELIQIWVPNRSEENQMKKRLVISVPVRMQAKIWCEPFFLHSYWQSGRCRRHSVSLSFSFDPKMYRLYCLYCTYKNKMRRVQLQDETSPHEWSNLHSEILLKLS